MTKKLRICLLLAAGLLAAGALRTYAQGFVNLHFANPT
jgi:hypothetical protein